MASPVTKRLDEHPRLLFWDAQTVFVAVVGVFGGALLNHLGVGLIVGGLLGFFWQRVSACQTRGYPLHITYWYLGGKKFRRTPASNLRHFVG